MKTLSIALVAAAAVAGCAADGGADGTRGTSALTTGQCFRGNDVNNFNVRDKQTLYVSTRQGYVFRVDSSAECFSTGMENVSLAPFTGADPRICIGDQAKVAAGQFRAPAQTCIARVSGPITDSRESGLRGRVD